MSDQTTEKAEQMVARQQELKAKLQEGSITSEEMAEYSALLGQIHRFQNRGQSDN